MDDIGKQSILLVNEFISQLSTSQSSYCKSQFFVLFHSFRELLADCYDKRGMFDKDKFMSSYVKVGVIEQATEKIFFKSGPWCSKGGQDN